MSILRICLALVEKYKGIFVPKKSLKRKKRRSVFPRELGNLDH